ncbi:MAG: dihydroorotase [Ignavibacteria bacterium]|nr:dihydroorotase [Ignavibacteria bacterium]MBP6510776.1 dihydroorotase [Candidatus Kapabacteria bacterium]MBK6761479.1 dihydroorotase [Ignavibacteria bacterium]MBK7033503.1 dihydroorotase [Ignavibacteria bacterium]MBK7186277.1 dihydroorotase [Ignavibacteria bacterium]
MEVLLRSPLDMHIHFRQDAMLDVVAPLSAQHFSGGVIMPNLVPPVDSVERLLWYTAEVKRAVGAHRFQPYMTLFFRDYTREELVAAKPHIIGIKLYPAGATTNSENGVREIMSMKHVFAMMEELDIPLLVHGETHGFVMDREREFCDVYRSLATTFPRLRITMEHITTEAAVALLDEFENLRATVTPHHLIITLDDVAGGILNPHLFCKPIAKRPEDRAALLEAALRPHPRLMMGSDSAPHPIHKKESAGCAAGVFTAPILLPMLAELFEQNNALGSLQAFVSDNARRLYGVEPPATTVHLVKEPMTIPDRYGDVVPMWAGKTLSWSVRSVE